MQKILLSVALTTLLTQAADSLESWFEEGTAKGNIRYYFIETDKETLGKSSDAHANAFGGTLGYTTGSLNGFKTGLTLMTTNGFLLPNSVDASIIGRDNGVRLEGYPAGEIAQEDFTVLGEAFVAYAMNDFTALYGRHILKSPLIDAKDVRMLPSAVQGTFVDYQLIDSLNLNAAYVTDFKQRTSDEFINIVEHALGAYTQAITGNTHGEVILMDVSYKAGDVTASLYDYYAQDFINSLYGDVSYKGMLNPEWSYSIAGQYIYQTSIGSAEQNLAFANSLTGGEQILTNALSAKAEAGYKASKLSLALSKVLDKEGKHDSLVLPWDGTPLYTNMLTSNNLFQSNYGKGLNADSVYIGGAQGVKLAYIQGYDFTGYKGFQSELSYLYTSFENQVESQQDLNAVIAYTLGSYSVALKGIWAQNNTAQSASGKITQDEDFKQFRVIANYQF